LNFTHQDPSENNYNYTTTPVVSFNWYIHPVQNPMGGSSQSCVIAVRRMCCGAKLADEEEEPLRKWEREHLPDCCFPWAKEGENPKRLVSLKFTGQE
jgi:hypothetical protein